MKGEFTNLTLIFKKKHPLQICQTKRKNMSGSGDPTLPIFSPDPKLFFSFEYEKNWSDFSLIFKRISKNVFKAFM